MSARPSTDAPAVGLASAPALRSAYAASEWRIMPILFCLWMLAWIDRANVAFAKLQMLSDLHFSEIVYGFGAGLFFLGYVVFGIPTSLLQQRIGARRTICAIAVSWGVTSMAMVFVHRPIPFYALRFLLGAFEAGFYPGVILYFNHWFPTQRRTRNFSIFHSAAIVSTLVVGLSGGFALEHMNGVLSLAGWRWMFLLQSAPTLLIGLLVWFVLPDGPATASWLSPEARALIKADLARDSGPAANGAERRPVLANPVVWVLLATYFCILTANSALGFYVPTILREAGFGSYSAIGNAIAAMCILAALGTIGFSTYASRQREILHFCAVASLISVASLFVLVLVWHSSRVATFTTLVIALAGTGAGVSLFWQTPSRYLHASVLAVAVPFISSVANIAGFLTPSLTGYLRETFGTYTSGFIASACVQAFAAVLLIAVLPRVLRNRARHQVQEFR
jgi:MFS family permease